MGVHCFFLQSSVRRRCKTENKCLYRLLIAEAGARIFVFIAACDFIAV
jgi:hypothetical protein